MPFYFRTLLALSVVGGALLTGCSDSSRNNLALPIDTGEDVGGMVQADLRLMETTDIHANVMDYNYYGDATDPKVGLVRTAMLIKNARTELDNPQNSVLVDNGDLIQGSPMGDWRQSEGLAEGEVHPVFKVMNELQYDVANYGNHEFNYGLAFLAESVDDANFPYISANIFVDDGDSDESNDQLYFEPYKLVEKTLLDRNGDARDITIGFIGFVPPQIMQWDKNNLEGKVKTRDIRAMAERFVPEMREQGADIVVAIPHSGISTGEYRVAENAENSSWHLADVEGIDAIMFGHSYLLFPSNNYENTEGVDIERGTIKGVPAVMPGYWGSHLGVIDLVLDYDIDADTWVIVESAVSTPAIFADNAAAVEADANLVAMLAADHQATIDYMNQPIGESTDDIFSFLALVKDDPSVQIVSDAQKTYVEKLIEGDVNLQHLPVLSAAAPFKACTRDGICADESSFTLVSKGELKVKNAADLYLYPNTLMAVKVTGAELVQWLECSASQFNQIDTNSSARQELVNFSGFPTYNFDVMDGVTYQIDVTQPARYDRDCVKISDGNRIVQLQYQGELVAEGDEFLVATNNYRAGGGKFAGTGGEHIVIESPDENRTVLSNYIKENSPVTPTADGNWSFAPIETAVDLQVVFRVPNTDRAGNFVATQAPEATFLEANENNEAVYELNLQ
ncbi:bifunctional 2',3'-cyclic-nucleotide 2'-phosphodiesterase/3'-nucleotidase [Microbulbifer sp. CAU 1566]|uniref:bifunctional 2',3'-cyclic-nucleotide 2'-phosphodiesterase/3'-nucleotidase n=1 Tax=Microbulbifer sp. CAU 1566 TaxID=2933269 RepID=UPI00200486A6|nr:bifunctional 2',3'-cyclic-nucleotide 2'-phosphodiesterase/3'-nucleotidase [Microbulbifer sp. CAU 1566]MCK7597063.1 bifunctional 2',3'-cyclic-nucleotide 2'-phosphodiesterase/3'-nucleotidase [Microbulbifer sp. CAU 1566]